MENKEISIVQSYLGLSSNKELTDKTFKDAMNFLKEQIRMNTSKYIEGCKVFDLKNDTHLFPQLKQEHKPMTKWEKFSKEKGLKPAKKSRRVWNEETKTWEFRYGGNSIQNQKLREGIVEGKKSVNQLKREKKARVEKNKKNMLKNRERALQQKNKK